MRGEPRRLQCFAPALVVALFLAGRVAAVPVGWSTFLGGSSGDQINDIAVHADGSLAIVGITGSTDFPLVAPYQATTSGSDAYAARIAADGRTILWSTYLGGSDIDNALAVAVDANGRTWVAGTTLSDDFPLLNPTQSTNRGGSNDAFVAIFEPDGRLAHSTYLGGNGSDYPISLVTDGAGRCWIGGHTSSTNFPLLAARQTRATGDEGFLTLLAADGARVVSTYFGGNSFDALTAVDLDASGNLFVGGNTTSTNFPLVNALHPARGGPYDAFLAKLDPTATTIAWSTLLGGSRGDWCVDLGVTSAGDVVTALQTESDDLTMVGAFQATAGGSLDAAVFRLASDGSAILHSTYYGGADFDQMIAAGFGDDGEAWIAGQSRFSDCPLHDEVMTGGMGEGDVFVAGFPPMGGSLIQATYWGGSLHDQPFGVAMDTDGWPIIAGFTRSPDLPVRGEIDATLGGVSDCLAFKPCRPSLAVIPPPVGDTLRVGARTAASSLFTWVDVAAPEGYEVVWDDALPSAFTRRVALVPSGDPGAELDLPSPPLVFFKVAPISPCGRGPR